MLLNMIRTIKIIVLSGLMSCILSCTAPTAPSKEITSDTSVTISAKVQMIDSPGDTSSAEPYLFADKNGDVYLSWIEKKSNGFELKFSSLRGDKWEAPKMISQGNNWFVNWADYPVITTNVNGHLISHFLEKSDKGSYTYDIKLVSSADSGKSWSAPAILHDDGKKAEHGFVSVLPYSDNYFITWLDGRNTEAETAGHQHEGHGGAMTLRGAIIDLSGKKISEWELDNRVCDCCQTSVAITTSGPVVVYRDRSAEEIRDISIVRLVNGKWTAPQTVFANNWKIDGCPVNGPRVSAIGNQLAVAWYSSPDKSDQVNIAFSSDGGASFQSPIRIDEGATIGRVDLEMLDSSSAIVSWVESGNIKACIVNADGKKDPSFIVANTSNARSAGFPQLAKSGATILFAWTDDKEKRIKSAKFVR
jgi:hypothetical protein